MLDVLIGAILVSFAPVMVKLLPFEAAGVAAVRNLSGGFFLLLALSILKPFSIKEVFQSKWLLLWITLSGTAFAVDMFLWNTSVLIVGAGLGTVLANTQVFYMTAWGVFNKEEKLDIIKLLSLIAGFVGLLLIARDDQSLADQENYLYGVVMGISAGLAYTMYMLYFRRAIYQSGKGTLPSLCFISLVCGFWTSIYAATTEGMTFATFVNLELNIWVGILFLGIIVHVGSWFLISRALQKLPPSLVGVTLLAQPLLSSVWGYAFFEERFTKAQVGGIILTLLGIGVIHLDRYRTRRLTGG